MSQQQNIKTVIVTGAAGYIGGAICIELKNQGYRVIGVDKRTSQHLKPYYDEFIQDDFVSEKSLNGVAQNMPDAIIHCAGTSLVGPSIKNPREYYDNNFVKTKNLTF
jgi:UDP-glucose 4-epimerase